MECFVLLSIIMDSKQRRKDEERAIKAYADNPDFLKKILQKNEKS